MSPMFTAVWRTSLTKETAYSPYNYLHSKKVPYKLEEQWFMMTILGTGCHEAIPLTFMAS